MLKYSRVKCEHGTCSTVCSCHIFFVAFFSLFFYVVDNGHR